MSKDRRQYPKLRLIPEKIAGHRCVWFDYKLSADLGFRFSILCECRDDIAGLFKVMLYEKDLGYEEVSVDCKPWIVTRIWRKSLTASQELALRMLILKGSWNSERHEWRHRSKTNTDSLMRSLVSKRYAESVDVEGGSVTYTVTKSGRQYIGDKDAKR